MPLDDTKRRPALDHGPRVQHRNGRLELVDAADPDRPNVTLRRARRVCHYNTAWRAGHLTDAEREACDRYAVLCEREEGAVERRDGPSVKADPWSRTPPLSAVQAIASLRAAHQAVGNDGAALLRLYVRDNLPVDEIARRRDERREVTMGRTRAAITRLAEHWGM